MRVKISRLFLRCQFVAFATFAASLLASCPSAVAQTETVLFNFSTSTSSFAPDGGLIFDKAGNLYGTAEFGAGVFELKPRPGGGWATKGIHLNGGYAFGGVIFGAAGNLYGTTTYGGSFEEGTVFELSPGSHGTWIQKNLHVFGKGKDGQIPEGPLVLDSSGNLYGITIQGGTNGGGIVFELTPNGHGSFNEKILHNFGPGAGPDGSFPVGGLIFDSAGNIYGGTRSGGTDAAGTVYELRRNSNGTWAETILYNFLNNGVDATLPSGPLIFDSAGNLYGDTQTGGVNNWGTVYELSPQIGGTWSETVLHNFNWDGADGIELEDR
jgi:uncharacterized repeat protein (TIGR03803 family)